MRTLPERFLGGSLPVLMAAMSLACTPRAYSQSPAAQSPQRVSSFLEARSQPPPRSRAALAGDRPASVAIRGAVERPGEVKLTPGIETLQEALRVVGGLAPDAVALRVLPGNEALGRLFAETADGAAVVELPVAELTGAGPIYLWPGDAVDVLLQPGTAATPHALEVAPAGSSAAAASPTPSGDDTRAQPPTGVLAAEAPASNPPAAPFSPDQDSVAPPQAVATDAALAELRDQIAALRDLVEKQNNALRSEIAQVRGEQVKLHASLEQDTRTRGATASPPSAPVARLSEEAAYATTKRVPARTTAAALHGSSVDQTESAGSATVIVSGSVKRPGVYSVVDVKTVGGAISAAGRRDDADLNAVEIRPEDQGSAVLGLGLGLGEHPNKRTVDLTAVALGTTHDLPLRGGEVIFVPAVRH